MCGAGGRVIIEKGDDKLGLIFNNLAKQITLKPGNVIEELYKHKQ
jgi:hypothetical protein